MRSLRGRLILIIVLLIAASTAAGFVMFRLFKQSLTAQAGQAELTAAQVCNELDATYRFYTSGWQGGTPDASDPKLRRDLTAVVVKALRNKSGYEGGLWEKTFGSIAYAFPTYEGSSPKTDVPEAELSRIEAANQKALSDEQVLIRRFDSTSQTLVIAACPLPGPIADLTAWAMTRIHPFSGASYQQLMAGLTVLVAAILGASFVATFMVLSWSRHIGRIEALLARSGIEDLPPLPTTGERELDRIVSALNDAGRRLAASREKAESLAKQVAAGERLAAIGRIAAGIAHEIRNPIAAIRLKAEVALDRGTEQKDAALNVVIGQIDRLDYLVIRLLNASEYDPPQMVEVRLAPFLQACAEFHRDTAARKNLELETQIGVEMGCFDPVQIRSALDNLVLNAIEAAPGGIVCLATVHSDTSLILRVTDEGKGPPDTIREQLFEPFVSGRTEGTGLGLSIVREIAVRHGGEARFRVTEAETIFEIDIPWQIS